MLCRLLPSHDRARATLTENTSQFKFLLTSLYAMPVASCWCCAQNGRGLSFSDLPSARAPRPWHQLYAIYSVRLTVNITCNISLRAIASQWESQFMPAMQGRHAQAPACRPL